MAVIVNCPKSFREFLDEQFQGVSWIPSDDENVKRVKDLPDTTIYVVNEAQPFFVTGGPAMDR
jgi:hypothetical protein